MRIILTLILVTLSTQYFAQDMFRFGLGLGIDKSKREFVQTISFDFNRTEEVQERAGKSLLSTAKGFYITPSADVNLGAKPSASEDNVTASFIFGKRDAQLPKIKDPNRQRLFVNSGELNPTFGADKNFGEILLYGEALYRFNFIRSYYTASLSDNGYLKRVFLFSFSAVANNGNRYNDALTKNVFFSQLGGGLEFKLRLRTRMKKNEKEVVFDRWVFKANTSCLAVLQDLREVYTNDVAGIIKASIDFGIIKQLSVGLKYKYGNLTPTYHAFHSLDFGIKVKYK